jgi:transcriptional regulator with AAA-type ATPase domain
VIDIARRVGQVDSTVLLTGESGVGEERIARFIHDESSRAGGPFVAINCGAVPDAGWSLADRPFLRSDGWVSPPLLDASSTTCS